jgi:uncharacterized protein
VPDVASRARGASLVLLDLAEFCQEELLPFLFADAEDERQQYTLVVHNVTAKLKREAAPSRTTASRSMASPCAPSANSSTSSSTACRTRPRCTTGPAGRSDRARSARSCAAAPASSVRTPRPRRRPAPSPPHRREAQVTVVDIHNLHDRAKRFVVGVTLRRAFEEKESTGQARPLVFVVLDELNKYAPRDGSSADQGDPARCRRARPLARHHPHRRAADGQRGRAADHRQLGHPRRRPARHRRGEAARVRLPARPHRQRATIAKPGTMIVSQPELPVPLVLEFPFPAWATRPAEAGAAPGTASADDDPFAGLVTEPGRT